MSLNPEELAPDAKHEQPALDEPMVELTPPVPMVGTTAALLPPPPPTIAANSAPKKRPLVAMEKQLAAAAPEAKASAPQVAPKAASPAPVANSQKSKTPLKPPPPIPRGGYYPYPPSHHAHHYPPPPYPYPQPPSTSAGAPPPVHPPHGYYPHPWHYGYPYMHPPPAAHYANPGESNKNVANSSNNDGGTRSSATGTNAGTYPQYPPYYPSPPPTGTTSPPPIRGAHEPRQPPQTMTMTAAAAAPPDEEANTAKRPLQAMEGTHVSANTSEVSDTKKAKTELNASDGRGSDTKPGAALKPAEHTSKRPLTESEILRAFPSSDASSVMLIHGRKVNLDDVEDNAAISMYPTLRAWMQDDPFRTVPRPLASVETWLGFPSSPTESAQQTPPTSEAHATNIPSATKIQGSQTSNTHVSVNAEKEDGRSMEYLRAEMIQRGRKMRQRHTQAMKARHRQGVEQLRRKGIFIGS